MKFRNLVMEPRRDWNALGPKLPPWFRRRLKRIDPKLVLQFMPPRWFTPGGADPAQYPFGVWAICRRLPGTTGWLLKKWVWNLADQHGRYQDPGMDTIEIIRMARDLARSGQHDVLEREFGRTIDAIKTEKENETRGRLSERLVSLFRKYDVVAGSNHVFMRGSSIEAA